MQRRLAVAESGDEGGQNIADQRWIGRLLEDGDRVAGPVDGGVEGPQRLAEDLAGDSQHHGVVDVKRLVEERQADGEGQQDADPVEPLSGGRSLARTRRNHTDASPTSFRRRDSEAPATALSLTFQFWRFSPVPFRCRPRWPAPKRG